MRQLEIKVLDIVDARCDHEVNYWTFLCEDLAYRIWPNLVKMYGKCGQQFACCRQYSATVEGDFHKKQSGVTIRSGKERL